MIKKAIKKYQEISNELGRGADEMFDLQGKERSQFIFHKKNILNGIVRDVAIWLHDNYEEIAKDRNWNTQESCKVEFANLPKENQKVMIEMAKRILES